MKISRAVLFTSLVMTLQMALAHRERQDPFWSLVDQSENYETQRREERARDYSFGHSQQDRDFFHAFRLDRDEKPSSESARKSEVHQDPVEERIMRMYQAGKLRDRDQYYQEYHLAQDTQGSDEWVDVGHRGEAAVQDVQKPVKEYDIHHAPVPDEEVMPPVAQKPVFKEPKSAQPRPVVHEAPKQCSEPIRPQLATPKQHVIAVKLADKTATQHEAFYEALKDSFFKDARGKQLLQRLERESVVGEFCEFLQAMSNFLAVKNVGCLAPFCSRNSCILRDLKRTHPRYNSVMLSFGCVPMQDPVDSKTAIRQLQKRSKPLKGPEGRCFVERLHDLCQRLRGADKPYLVGVVRAVVKSWLSEHDLAMVVELRCGDYLLFSQSLM